jgi:DNA-binding CsgD family transcriptional regulator
MRLMTQPFALLQGAGGEAELPAAEPEGGLVGAALDADRARGRTPLASLWRDLVDGTAVVVHPFYDADRAYLVLEDVTEGSRASACRGRNLQLLRRAIGGQMQKIIAADFALANSTVASVAARCLQSMGFCCTGSRLPMLLVMASHADAIHSRQAMRSNAFRFGRAHYRVVSSERPDRDLPPVLSSKEQEVVRAALEGRSAVEIALLRKRSVHTVTNQLASSFHKLGVGSRSSLLWHLVSQSSEDPPSPRLLAPAERIASFSPSR